MPDEPALVPTPDRSVRIAWVADAAAMGRTQARAWQASYRGLLPAALLDSLDADELAATWAGSLRRPPLATHRALVALEGPTVVGFAAMGPSDDPDADPVRDAQMSVLVVDPQARGRGHGSRLLAAVADTGRADGFRRLTTWLFAHDDALRAFLVSTGWAPDGAHREVVLDLPGPPLPAPESSVRQIRLHTAVEDT